MFGYSIFLISTQNFRTLMIALQNRKENEVQQAQELKDRWFPELKAQVNPGNAKDFLHSECL